MRRRLDRLELQLDALAAKVAKYEVAFEATTRNRTVPANGALARMFHDALTELRIGRLIGPYRVLQRIGVGGMGTVYRAQDMRDGRQVALKFLAAPVGQGQDERPLRWFNREARAASSVTHPNICTVHDVGDDEGTPFLVMELLRGKSLRQRLVSGPIPFPELLDVAIPITDALDVVHGSGFIHRDLTPGNIFITDRGVPKLLDFGLASDVKRPVESDDSSHSGEFDRTGPQTIVGTPGYMSPEQLLGLPLDARSDLFSLGTVVYEMAIGHALFGSKGARPASIRRISEWSHPGLAAVIGKALKMDPDCRYQSARDFMLDLERLKEAC
jgi:serine/threonine protein kinase